MDSISAPTPREPGDIAHDVLHSLAHGEQREPFTTCDATFDLARAYATAHALRELRERRGERLAGRKIGFTNVAVRTARGVAEPIWGDVFDSTLHHEIESLTLPNLCELRIEPEIVFGFAAVPQTGMSDLEMLRCAAWIAPGFEIVQSIFPAWQLRAPDAVANGGMHAALVVGRKLERRGAHAFGEVGDDALLEALASFDVELSCDGTLVERGRGNDVMGASPLAALHWLADAVARDGARAQLRAGDVVTTGTLTREPLVAAGQRWTMRCNGLPLAPLELATRAAV